MDHTPNDHYPRFPLTLEDGTERIFVFKPMPALTGRACFARYFGGLLPQGAYGGYATNERGALDIFEHIGVIFAEGDAVKWLETPELVNALVPSASDMIRLEWGYLSTMCEWFKEGAMLDFFGQIITQAQGFIKQAVGTALVDPARPSADAAPARPSADAAIDAAIDAVAAEEDTKPQPRKRATRKS